MFSGLGTSCRPKSLALRARDLSARSLNWFSYLSWPMSVLLATILQLSVNTERKFMCSGNDAFGFSEARTNATAKRAKRAVAAGQAYSVTISRNGTLIEKELTMSDLFRSRRYKSALITSTG